MKKMIFLTALCAVLTTAVQAQINSLTVTNNSNCTVYYELWGEVIGSTYCAGSHSSGVLSLAASSSVTYTDPSTLTMSCGSCSQRFLGVNDNFVAADLYDSDPANCTPTIQGIVGEACGGHGTTAGPYNVDDGSCTSCGNVTATWNSAGTSLTFN